MRTCFGICIIPGHGKVSIPDVRAAQHLSQLGYLLVGLAAALPCFLLPLWLQPAEEAWKPLLQRHWVKANIWVAVFSFVGNYFWTHYFYTLLGAQYTFRTWRLNDVSHTFQLAPTHSSPRHV